MRWIGQHVPAIASDNHKNHFGSFSRATRQAICMNCMAVFKAGIEIINFEAALLILQYIYIEGAE